MFSHEFNTTMWNFMKAREKWKMLAHGERSKFFVFHTKIAYHTLRHDYMIWLVNSNDCAFIAQARLLSSKIFSNKTERFVVWVKFKSFPTKWNKQTSQANSLLSNKHLLKTNEPLPRIDKETMNVGRIKPCFLWLLRLRLVTIAIM